ncbi:unnamed protein product [Heligmosomoides polygyrus]|uniref:Uncharacterized protein n=1 Tax=Heligmosomoides polygyrus TaxID=6339 RepID=A0A3P8DUJ0_HELPZ|nr:unnamed protein product [Heligmosomoides polygyrus]
MPPNPNRRFLFQFQLVRSRDRDNYQAVLTMPKVFHPELFALLAFNVELALVREKISAQHGTDAAGMYRLQFWRDALSAIYGDSVAPVPRQPVAIALCTFAPRASLSLLDSLVVARQQTIGDRPFKTMKDLENYGKSTTGALLSLQLDALSRRSSDGKFPEVAIQAATELGVAYGVINLARSFLPLLSKGVVLLPSDLMALYGLTPDRVYNRKDPDGLVNLAKDLVASAHLASSRGFTPSVPRAHRRALAPTSSIVDYIINRTIEVLHELPELGRLNLLWNRSLTTQYFPSMEYTQEYKNTAS